MRQLSRLTRAWDGLGRDERLAAVAALALLVTMFFPWYGLQSVNRKTGAISSHTINAFGDVSFVEAAVFLVAAGVIVILVARAERRAFELPGGDGTIVMVAGAWAAILIFYRVFDRPSGGGYPVGIEWGFFLAFLAAGGLAYAGWRLRSLPRALAAPEPEEDLRRAPSGESPGEDGGAEHAVQPREPLTPRAPAETGAGAEGPAGEIGGTPRGRPRYPPAPGEQMSLEDHTGGTELHESR